jgi:protoporphyrinogen oxidase
MRVGVLGAGIAGLAVAWFLRDGADVCVHEASGQVGGLARSFKWHGFDCDLAPHRFLTRDEALLRQVMALVPMRRLARRSRIRLRGRWIRDPINIFEVMYRFMPLDSARIVWHYVVRPKQREDSFEALVLNNYGRGLHDLFFKPYSEKLFGIPAQEISPSWGRRKIRVSGFRDLVRRDPRLYFEHFYYPVENGYGAIANRLYADVRQRVHLHSRVVGLTPLAGGGYECRFETPAGVARERYDVIVSTLPMPELGALLGFDIALRFRPMTLLYLLVGVDRVSDCHWTYFADRDVMVNRVAEFKHFSVDAPRGTTVICCEITDTAQFSIARVVDELSGAGFLPTPAPVLDAKIIRLERAYPIYDRSYDEQIERARQGFAAHPAIFHIGRQAQFVHKDVDEILEEAKMLVSVMRPESGRWPHVAP